VIGLHLSPDHVYTLNGRVIPGVTSVINAVLQPDYSYATEWHMQRGTAVHKAAELIMTGKRIGPVCDAIQGQVEALKRWRADHAGIEVISVERRVHTASYGGTLDLLFTDSKRGAVLLDWKCGPHITTCWQLGGYAHALKTTDKIEARWGRGVTLNGDGTYNETEDYDLRRYVTEWQWIFGVWKIKQGVK
jgi:hypothetical protein